MVETTAGWVGPTGAIALVVIALAFAIIAGVALVLARAASHEVRELAQELARIRGELSPALHALQRMADAGLDLSHDVRQEVEKYLEKSRSLRKDLDRGVHRQVPPEGPGPGCSPPQGAGRRSRRPVRGAARGGGGHRPRRRGPAPVDAQRRAGRHPAPPVPGPGTPMTFRRVAVALVLAGVWVLAHPAAAHAWSPGTHVFLGETILANLQLLPPSVATLLQAFPYDFLYGSIAPDTSIAKKYVPPGRHSHFWHVGQETFDFAGSDALRAFGLGYLSHLAADTIAHNYYVPRQLVLTASTRSMGHSYWESRVETQL